MDGGPGCPVWRPVTSLIDCRLSAMPNLPLYPQNVTFPRISAQTSLRHVLCRSDAVCCARHPAANACNNRVSYTSNIAER
ncbi:hypothetical protein EVAR_64224_1 [Eumeta japonica]|uniref:Uncharacterized protein n=1 Tax=Eumeta variegata TaxID=151549 RepID=A0A4C1ZLT8_EUMVA|nr:hypothetical protein EVAR_64224_1 [Eumeta japonica]